MEIGDMRVKCAECERKVPVKRTLERDGRTLCWLCAGLDPWQDHTPTTLPDEGEGEEYAPRKH